MLPRAVVLPTVLSKMVFPVPEVVVRFCVPSRVEEKVIAAPDPPEIVVMLELSVRNTGLLQEMAASLVETSEAMRIWLAVTPMAPRAVVPPMAALKMVLPLPLLTVNVSMPAVEPLIVEEKVAAPLEVTVTPVPRPTPLLKVIAPEVVTVAWPRWMGKAVEKVLVPVKLTRDVVLVVHPVVMEMPWEPDVLALLVPVKVMVEPPELLTLFVVAMRMPILAVAPAAEAVPVTEIAPLPVEESAPVALK